MPNQIEMISLEELVPKSHQYRKFIILKIGIKPPPSGGKRL